MRRSLETRQHSISAPAKCKTKIRDEHKHCIIQPFETEFGGHRGLTWMGARPWLLRTTYPCVWWRRLLDGDVIRWWNDCWYRRAGQRMTFDRRHTISLRQTETRTATLHPGYFTICFHWRFLIAVNVWRRRLFISRCFPNVNVCLMLLPTGS